MKHFHNTTCETGRELAKHTLQAMKQEDAFLEIMKREKKLSPSQLLAKYIKLTGKENVPIQSCRRGLTNLTSAGYLEKTEDKVLAQYGRSEYIWKLKGIL